MTRISSTFGRGQRLGLRRNTPLVDLVPPSGALTLGSVGPNVIAVGSPNFFVAPNGLPTNGGQLGSPWDLQTALSGAGNAITPGSTVWLRGGAYSGQFTVGVNGTSTQRITCANYPGERASIGGDGSIASPLAFPTGQCSYVDFRSTTSGWLEIYDSNPAAGFAVGIDVHGVGCRLINLVVHDTSASGCGLWQEATAGLLYGNLIYNVGRHNNLDHGIYTQNGPGDPIKRIANNIILSTNTYGVQMYGTLNNVNHYLVEDNIIALPGNCRVVSSGAGFWIVANSNDITLQRNAAYQYGGQTSGGGSLSGAAGAGGLIFRNNWVDGDLAPIEWDVAPISLTFSGNTISCPRYDFVFLENVLTPGATWDNNTWYMNTADAFLRTSGVARTLAQFQAAFGYDVHGTAAGRGPTGTHIFTTPNEFEAKRAHIAVYNYSDLPVVDLDFSSFLVPGDNYVVRNVLNIFGTPVASGTYTGASVSVPTTGLAHPTPTGLATPATPQPRFNAFIVRSL